MRIHNGWYNLIIIDYEKKIKSFTSVFKGFSMFDQISIDCAQIQSNFRYFDRIFPLLLNMQRTLKSTSRCAKFFKLCVI